MRYDDLAIEIRALPRRRYEVRVASSTQGRGRASFKLPVPSDQLDQVLRALERRVWRSRLLAEEARELEAKEHPEEPQGTGLPCPEQLGEALFSSLFHGDSARVLHSSLGQVDGRQVETDDNCRGLRLRFVFDQADADLTEVAVVPWELLLRADTKTFLARHRRTPIVRCIEVPEPVRPLRVRGDLRVLLVEAAPEDLTSLETPLEARHVRETLERIGGVEVVHVEHATLASFQNQLRRGGWHVVHFMGHGKFDRTTGEALLCFETRKRKTARVAAQYFAEHVKQDPSVRLVILNACATGTLPRRRGQDPFSAAAAALARVGIPAVVAMQFPISDPAAVAFAKELYQGIAEGEALETAVVDGRLAIYREGSDTPSETLEWVTPVLYLRGDDGTMLEVEPEERARRRGHRAAPDKGEPGEERQTRPLRLGIRSLVGLGEDLEAKADRPLSLVDYFEGRWIKHETLWREAVLPKLGRFLGEGKRSGRPLILDLAAHQSLAFATGSLLEAKSGVEISVIQRGQKGTFEWPARPGESPTGPLWKRPKSIPRDGDARDVAVAVSATWDVLADVTLFLDRTKLAVRRILHVVIAPEPSSTSVRDGAHALRLAQTLSRLIRERTPEERLGTIHLFAAAPNGLLLFLGQIAPALGPVQLYEYDFETKAPGAYRPSFRLPA